MRSPDLSVIVRGMECCAECGFVYDIDSALSAGAGIVHSVGELSKLLSSTTADLRTRPEPRTVPGRSLNMPAISGMCCSCTVKRVLVAGREDRPLVTPMGIEERVEHDGYDRSSGCSRIA
jgi:hypothetical protein